MLHTQPLMNLYYLRLFHLGVYLVFAFLVASARSVTPCDSYTCDADTASTATADRIVMLQSFVRTDLETENFAPGIDALDTYGTQMTQNLLSNESLEGRRWHPKTKPVVQGTKVKFNMAGDLPQFLAGLRFNAGCIVFLLVVFTFLQRWYPLVYSFRAIKGGETAEFVEHPAPRTWGIEEKSWFRWIQVSLGTTSEEIEKHNGLDAAMLFQFFNFSMQLMVCIGLPMASIMIPIYYHKGGGFAGDDHLSWFGIGNVIYNETDVNGTTLSEAESKLLPQVQWIYWVLAAAVWFVVVFTQCLLLWHQIDFLKRRLKWMLAMPFPQCTTILVEGIPRAFASDRAITEFFENEFGEDAIQHAFVLKRLQNSHLHELIREYWKTEQRIHELQFQIAIDVRARPTLNNGEDELLHLQREQKQLAASISMEQLEVKRLAAQVDDAPDKAEFVTTATVSPSGKSKSEITTGISEAFGERVTEFTKRVDDMVELAFDNQSLYATNGFVVFKTRQQAEEALEHRLSTDRNEWRVSHPPPPSDIIYRNLEVSDRWKTSQKFWGHLSIVGLFFAFMPLVVAISHVTLLIVKVPFIVGLLESTGMKEIVENLCSTVGITIMMSVLPTLLRCIFVCFFPAKSGGIGQAWLQQYYFWFLLVFVLLVTAVGIDLRDTISSIIASPASICLVLAERLPGTTHFYLTYTAFQSVTFCMNLIRVMNLCKFMAYSHTSSPQRAYELSEPEDQDYYGIGSRSARMSLFLAIGLVFGTICPLMNFVVLFTFAMCRVTYGYLIPYAETKKNDLGGLHWVKQLEHVNVSLLIYIIMMTGILFLQAESKWPAFVAGCSFLWWLLPVWELERGMKRKKIEGADSKHDDVAHEKLYDYCQPELEWSPEGGNDPCKMHVFGLDDVSFFLASSLEM